MALRALAARMRASAGARPSSEGGQQGKRFDLDRASEEELLRESELISKQIDETWEAVRRENDKVPGLTKGMFGIVKMSFGAGILIEMVWYAAPMLRPAAEPEQ